MRSDWKPRHVGLIVKDIEKAIRHYQALGFPAVGPKSTIRDEDGHESLKVDFIQIGAMQIEFFQPVHGGSIQQAFLEKHGEGIQHLAFTVTDLDWEIADLVRDGWQLLFRREAINGSKIAYFDTGAVGDILIELVQPVAESRGW